MRLDTFSSQARQREASSAAQKRIAAALSQTSQSVRIIPQKLFLLYLHLRLPVSTKHISFQILSDSTMDKPIDRLKMDRSIAHMQLFNSKQTQERI